MKTIAIVQSNYIPWKGYFDMIRAVDEFILFDDAQYTRRDWRNRNRIKTARGIQWLTIPVEVKGKYFQKIRETRISDPDWARTHWQTLRASYGKAPFFRDLKDRFEAFYLGKMTGWLSDVNRELIVMVCGLLDVATPIRASMDLQLTESDPSARLLEICLQLQATEYLSGPAARNYLDVALFEKAGVRVRWMEYAGYPAYPQLHGPFEHAVSVVDLLFMTGPAAGRYLERGRPMRLSVVATLYCSAPYLREFHRRASEAARRMAGDSYEIVLVNDGSPDESLNIALELRAIDSCLRIVDLSRNFGHHRAMWTGLQYARGEWVFLLDSDLEESPEWLAELDRRRIETGADVVFGVQESRSGNGG